MGFIFCPCDKNSGERSRAHGPSCLTSFESSCGILGKQKVTGLVECNLYPLMQNGPVNPYHLDKTIFKFRVVGFKFK